MAALSDFLIQHGLFAMSVGRRLGGATQLSGLRLGKWQRNFSHTFDVKLRKQERKGSGGMEVARAGYSGEGVEKLIHRCHGI